MAVKKDFKKISEEEADLSLRIFNLIIGRVLKRIYLDFDEKVDESIKEILNNRKNVGLAKKYMPDFKKIFDEEAVKIEKEIKDEIKSQNILS